MLSIYRFWREIPNTLPVLFSTYYPVLLTNLIHHNFDLDKLILTIKVCKLELNYVEFLFVFFNKPLLFERVNYSNFLFISFPLMHTHYKPSATTTKISYPRKIVLSTCKHVIYFLVNFFACMHKLRVKLLFRKVKKY